MNKFRTIDIVKVCSPAKGTVTKDRTKRVWSLTQLGAGMPGEESRTLACLFDRLTDEHGNYQGETPYVVVGDIHAHTPVARLLKNVEWRVAFSTNQVTGLLYRKLPSPNGFANSWLTSAETAVQSWIGTWGRVTSNRNAGVYRFEPLNLPGRQQPSFPDIDELINELLADYVIDRLDHPALQRILAPESPPDQMGLRVPPADLIDEEEDDDAY